MKELNLVIRARGRVNIDPNEPQERKEGDGDVGLGGALRGDAGCSIHTSEDIDSTEGQK